MVLRYRLFSQDPPIWEKEKFHSGSLYVSPDTLEEGAVDKLLRAKTPAVISEWEDELRVLKLSVGSRKTLKEIRGEK